MSLSTQVMLRPRNLNDPNGFYRLLGVEPWASDKEIKRAYRREASKSHPDGPHPDEERFHLVRQAYDVLSNHREEYNRLPEGVRWLLDGEEPGGDGVSVSLDDLNSEELPATEAWSYYYIHGENDELAQQWYEALREELPKWGYRGRVALKLGDKVDTAGRRFEVPYEPPNSALLFMAGVQAISAKIMSTT